VRFYGARDPAAFSRGRPSKRDAYAGVKHVSGDYLWVRPLNTRIHEKVPRREWRDIVVLEHEEMTIRDDFRAKVRAVFEERYLECFIGADWRIDQGARGLRIHSITDADGISLLVEDLHEQQLLLQSNEEKRK
jgi:hypothetical protein